MKPSRLIRHLNIKHSELVNKPIEFFKRKKDALKIEKKVISQVSTTDTSLLTASNLISLQIAKCENPYSIGENLAKPFLIAACNEVLGQSAASKMIDIPLLNDTVERRISDMAEDTETQLTEKIKNRNYLHYNWKNLQIFRTTAFYLYMYDILPMMKVT